MTALTVDMVGVTYRIDTANVAWLSGAVHAALTGLGFTAYVSVPADLHAPNLARQVTDRTGRDW